MPSGNKYNAIFPPDVYGKWVRALNGDRELWVELNPTMIQYLNLVWEESYLSLDGRYPDDCGESGSRKSQRFFRQTLRETQPKPRRLLGLDLY
jgi:hypothetical protein